MKITKTILLMPFLISLLFLTGIRCSSRQKKPVTLSDSTIGYPPKKADGVSAAISLYRKIDKKTGKRIGEGAAFTLMEKTRVHARADIENFYSVGEKELMFHFNWIGPDGKSLYKKRIGVFPSDSILDISSTISISPELRLPGNYKIQLYFFRELIAEKDFLLFPEFNSATFYLEKNRPQITLSKKTTEKTENRINGDTVFEIGKKEKVHALFNLGNRLDYGNRELLFRFEWFGEDTTAFYRKRIYLSVEDSSSTIKSAISIASEKRKPGNYGVKLFLFNKPIAEKRFELKPEPKTPPIKANIKLYRKLDKKTEKYIGEGTEFKIGNKRKVRASVTLYNRFANIKKELKFMLEWIGPDGKVFYRKKIKLKPNDPTSTIKSAISISPEKRQPGNYIFRISLFNKRIAEKKFILFK
jgi:hypothetical protein